MFYSNLKKLSLSDAGLVFKIIVLVGTQSRSQCWGPKQNNNPFVPGGTHLFPDSVSERTPGNRTHGTGKPIWKYSHKYFSAHSEFCLSSAQGSHLPGGLSGGTGCSACPVASWGARSTLPARWSLEGRPDALRRAPPPLWSPAGSTLVLGLGAVAVCHPMGMLRDLLCSPWTPGEVSTALLSPLQDPPRRVSVLGSPLVSQVAQWWRLHLPIPGDARNLPWVGRIPLEEGMATHSSILTWEIPWTEEPGGCSPQGRKELDTTEWLSTHARHCLCRFLCCPPQVV